MLVGEDHFESVLMYLPNEIKADSDFPHSSMLSTEHADILCFEPPFQSKSASRRNSLSLDDNNNNSNNNNNNVDYNKLSYAVQSVHELVSHQFSLNPNLHLRETPEPCALALTEMYRSRVEVALKVYYRHSYQPFIVDSSSQYTRYSLFDDIKLASRIPNRLQETFQDRLEFLLKEHGFLITRDALLRPADETDTAWQEMLHQTNLDSDSDVPVVVDDKGDDDVIVEEELLIDEDKEEDKHTFRSVMAQGAGAYLFTTLIPVALGFPVSLPMLSITACVGAVAGQVAWDSFEQQKLLYPLHYYANNSSSAAVADVLSLNPPRYKPALREWRRGIFMALVYSERGCTMQQHSMNFFAEYWLKLYQKNPTEFPFINESGAIHASVGSASTPSRLTTEKEDEEGWEMLNTVAAHSSGCDGDNFV
jgi:hypothetical protein